MSALARTSQPRLGLVRMLATMLGHMPLALGLLGHSDARGILVFLLIYYYFSSRLSLFFDSTSDARFRRSKLEFPTSK